MCVLMRVHLHFNSLNTLPRSRDVFNKNTIASFLYDNHFDNTMVFSNRYTANFYPMKTTGTGNYGVPAGKTCTIYGKGL